MTFHRDRAGVIETLTPGTAITPGDQLFLKVESDQSLYFYVVNQDEASEQYVLFPRPELDLNNPLPPGNELQLPGTINGIEQRWDVTSSGGRETILVVASQTALGQVEQFIARLNQTDPDDETLDLLGQLRGIGGLSAATPSDSPADLNSIRSSLNQADKGMVKVWELTFENPH